MTPHTPFSRLPELLTAAGYDRSIVETAERVLNSGDMTLISLRLLLEQFFRASTQMDKAVRYLGDQKSFGATLDFARSRDWVTEPEQRFISATYGLISDIAAHTGRSIIEPDFARAAVLHALWLVLNRFQVRASRPFAGYGGSAGRLGLADQFLKGVRTGAVRGPAFEVEFDQDLMQLTRQRLRYADVVPLMSFIKNEEASVRLRTICASLVLSPRCYKKPSDGNWPRIVSELDAYCRENLQRLPWQLSRAIGLALANRTNHADRLLDYLDWIGRDAELVEKNLAQSDGYNGGTDKATEYYMSRIQNVDIPLSGCVWEAFYISRRRLPKGNKVRRVLARRIAELERGRLRTFFQSAVDLLPQQSGEGGRGN